MLLLAATVSWITSLALTAIGPVSDYGLIALMHPLFVVGFVLLCTGFVTELWNGQRAAVLSLSIILLVLMINATVSVLFIVPEYAWTFKHVGVIEFFRRGEGVVDPADIYQQWPSLFASVAAVADLAGIDTLRLSGWAPAFFSMLQCLPMFAIFRQLSSDHRVAYLGVFIFQSCIWVGTSYLSPQAIAFQLTLGVILILVTWLSATPQAWRRGPRSIRRFHGWLTRGCPQAPRVSRASRSAALWALFLIFLAITASHQLTPFIVLATLGMGVILGLIRPRLVLVVCIALTLLYLAPRLSFITSSYGLFDSLRFWQNAQGVVDTTTGTSGQVLTSRVSIGQTLLVLFGMALAVLRSRREMGRILLPTAFALAPFLILFGQSYGGEAIYRVYLFSLPWCAYLIADAVMRSRRGVLVPGMGVALAVMALASIQGLHGSIAWTTFSRAEVEAARYYYDNAPKRSILVLGVTNFPIRLTANYGDYGVPSASGDIDLIQGAGFRGTALNEDSVEPLGEFMSAQGPSSYLILSKGMTAYAHYYGLLPDGALQSLDEALSAAPGWSVFYRNSDTVIYRYR
jgi:hypothetical protein